MSSVKPRKRRALIWDHKVPACVNCSSTRHDRRSRGYCARCFRYAEPLRIIEKHWDADDPRTWRGSPYRYGPAPSQPKEYVAALRSRLQSGLEMRHITEQQIRGELPINGMTFEGLFGQLAGILHVPKGRMRFYNWATAFDHAFDQKARTMIFEVVTDLIETRPGRSVHIQAMHDMVRKLIKGR